MGWVYQVSAEQMAKAFRLQLDLQFFLRVEGQRFDVGQLLRLILLIADDETHILNVLSIKLTNAGYNVITAEDGVEAYALACEVKPDLVITDFQMPGLSAATAEGCSDLAWAAVKIATRPTQEALVDLLDAA